ncbi:hypothetical protein PR202_gb28482 [Eleusine coracana subsp. coracana]|uniref:Peptidase A1 domain-containing protein n=1 Tax=Eleusine coracana subsp. coracana TaxID=191504 RepID=A0AAV5FUM6_ELECO|nr:hypothetical protein PR202_gb28482 [Eleusine coracana subsp. coracana]
MAHFNQHRLLTIAIIAAFLANCHCEASGGFGFDLHHRSSPVVRRLYYAEVSVGTPNETLLVALDTGSDFFWVPCEDCKHCAPIPKEPTGEPDLRPYNPRKSSTSKPVTNNNACRGNGKGSSCPYSVQYVSANTSSSGVLVEDVVYLTSHQRGRWKGLALAGACRVRVSVPSVLAARGLIASDSFSMCFGHDGVGRLNFPISSRLCGHENKFQCLSRLFCSLGVLLRIQE